MSDSASGEFEGLKRAIIDFLSEKDEHCKFEELDAWSRDKGYPRLTLRIALNELIDAGTITGSTERAEVDDYAPWVKIPREISLKKEPVQGAVVAQEDHTEVEPPQLAPIDSSDPNLRRAIEYLNDYPSVGLMRFNLDLRNSQVPDIDKILMRLTEEGYVEVSPMGVVNATSRLPKITRKVTLGDLLGPRT